MGFRDSRFIIFCIFCLLASAGTVPLSGVNTVMNLAVKPAIVPERVDVTAVVAGEQPGQAAMQLSEKDMEQLERCYAKFQSISEYLGVLLQQAAHLINKKKISVASPDDVLARLLNVQTILNKFYAQPCVPLELISVQKRLRAVDTIAKMALDEFKTNAAFMDGLSYDRLNAYLPREQLTVASVLQTARVMEDSVVRLEEYIKQQEYSVVGEAYVGTVEWAQRHGIVHLAVGAASIAAAVGVVAYVKDLSVDSPLFNLQQRLYGVFGYPDETLDRFDRYLGIITKLGTIAGLAWQFGSPMAKSLGEAWKSLDARMRGDRYRPTGQMDYVNGGVTMDDPCIQVIKGQLSPLFDILKILKHPETSAHVPIPKSILIAGPSGCSKTFSVKAFRASLSALLRENGIPLGAGFREISLPELAKESDPCAKLEEIFNECSSQGIYVVLWWDEFHSAQLQVGGNSVILAKLLTILQDKADRGNWDKCIFIAATNRFELLDAAFLRRWSKIIYMSLPDLRQRAGAISAIAQMEAIALQEPEIMRLAIAVPDASFGDLNKMFEEGKKLAIMAHSAVNFEYLYKGINAAVRQLEERLMPSADENHLLAVELAAQALFYLYAGDVYGSPTLFESMTMWSAPNKIKEKYDGMVKWDGIDIAQTYQVKPGAFYTYRTDEHIATQSLKEPFVSCMGYLVKAAAAEHILGIGIAAADNGTNEAYGEALRLLVGVKGVRELPDALKQLPEDVSAQFKTQAWAEVGRCKGLVVHFIGANKDKILNVAERLEKDLFMRYEQVQELLAEPTLKVSPLPVSILDSKPISGVFSRELALFAKPGSTGILGAGQANQQVLVTA